jgi:hypothetical protein
MKKYLIASVAVLLLALLGCREDASDERVIEAAVKQDKHTGDIATLSTRIEGFENRLAGIEKSLQKVPEPTGSPEPAATAEEKNAGPKVVEFKDTPEYGQIAADLSAIQQQLTLTEGSLGQTKDEMAREEEQRRLRDPAEAWRVMNDPQEMNRRLTLLAQNFVPTIQDPVKRQQFEADVEQLKRSLSEKPDTQQLYQQTVADLTARLNQEQDERARQFIQNQIQSLETASADELQGRLERYNRFGTVRLLRDLQSKYDISRETYTNAGLPSMGMGGGGFRGPGGQGGRAAGRRGGGQ